MASEEETELTSSAKLAIQRYMLKFVIPSATALSIISVAVGFGLDRVARNEAYTEFASRLLDANAKVETARAKAEALTQQLQTTVTERMTDIQKRSELADTLITSLRQQKLDVDKTIGGNFDKIADTIYGKEEFRSSLVKISAPELADVKSQLDGLSRYYSVTPSGPVSVVSDLKCPLGQVLVEIALELGGTCNRQCDADGRPIRSIYGKCQKLGLVKAGTDAPVQVKPMP